MSALVEKLKELFKGHPDAEALIAQAEAEEAAKAKTPEQQQAQAVEVAEVADVNAPHPRNVTQYERYMRERAK